MPTLCCIISLKSSTTFAGFSPLVLLNGANVSSIAFSISLESMGRNSSIPLANNAAFSPAIFPKTIRSESEFPPSLLAPCSPVAASPAANILGTVVSCVSG